MPDDNKPATDPALVARLLDHDREELIAMAYCITRDRHEAEDVVQETVAAVWKLLPDISPDKLTHYLTCAIRQNAIKRKSRRREFASLHDSSDHAHLAAEARASVLDPIDLEDAIRSLPPGQQTVIRMKYYLGMTFEQIGTSLSVSANTAASRCRYALVKLKQLLLP